MQRLRIKFSRGAELKFISHLDIIRLWQRAFNRAGIEVAHSEGFNPHPKISLAAPLPLGVTSEAELMDVFCSEAVSPHHFAAAVGQQLPTGIGILQTLLIAVNLPSLQSLVRFAEYRVELDCAMNQPEVEAAIFSLLNRKELPWQHQRDTGPHKYDLRALIDNLRVIAFQPAAVTLGMKLRCDSSGSGRPEQVALALGFQQQPLSIHRTGLIMATR